MYRSEFVAVVREFLKVKSIYAYGQFGTPISDTVIMEKQPYQIMTYPRAGETTRAYILRYNAQKSRATAKTAPEGTFGADCTGLVQLALCGWKGDKTHYLGGCDPALYDVRLTAAETGKRCGYKGGVCAKEKWNSIKPGDILLQTGDNKVANHVAVYIGDGIAAEVAYDWCGAGYGMTDGCQTFRLAGVDSTGKMATYSDGATKARHWCDFGTLPCIEDDPVDEAPKADNAQRNADVQNEKIAELTARNQELRDEIEDLKMCLEIAEETARKWKAEADNYKEKAEAYDKIVNAAKILYDNIGL